MEIAVSNAAEKNCRQSDWRIAPSTPSFDIACTLLTAFGWTINLHEADLLGSIGRDTAADLRRRCTFP